MNNPKTIAIVGATNAVGAELIKILDERVFPIKEIIPIAASSGSPNHIDLYGDSVAVRALDENCFQGVDIVFFSAGPAISKEYCPLAVKAGCVVIDDSGCFSLDADVPLIIPEINAKRIKEHKGIIATPSASSVQLALVLAALQKKADLKRVVVSTYQAVSSAGHQGVKELSDQIESLFNFKDPQIKVFNSQIAFNCQACIGEILDDGYSQEEMLIEQQTRKILGDEKLQISATAVQIPIFYGHCEALHIETKQKLTADQARDLLSNMNGIILEDEPQNNIYPQPLFSVGKDEIFVGRIRESKADSNALSMWVVSDNIRKGSALNAVQIAELLLNN